MKELWDQYFKQNYFTDPIGFLVCLVGLFLLLKNRNKVSGLQIFISYFLSYLFLKIVNYYLNYLVYSGFSYPIVLNYYFDYLDFIFTVLEYYIFAYYLRNLVNSYILKLSIAFFGFSAVFIFTSSLTSKDPFFNAAIFNSQAIALLMLCFSYYFQLFNKASLRLFDEPSFWIVSGISIFMLSTLPYSILLDQLYTKAPELHTKSYMVFYVFYIILFLMIIKAVLTSKKNIYLSSKSE